MRTKWPSYILCYFFLFIFFVFSHYYFLDFFKFLGFPLPIDAFCDCISARTSVQALGLLFRMAHTEILCDTGNVKVFVVWFSQM
jgi:hypothetical protein